MENIDLFISELRHNTEDNIDSRKSREENERQKHDKNLNEHIERLVEDIMKNGQEKMFEASKQGHYYATLYEFTNNDVYDPFDEGGYKTVFLMKGPIRARGYDGLAYFEHKGIEPLLQRVSKRVSPMGVFIKYDRIKRAYMLIVSWKNT